MCHRPGHFAREWRHQSQDQANRNFRESEEQSFGGPRFGKPYSQVFGQPVGQQNGLSTPCQRSGGRRPHALKDCPAASAVCYNCGRQGHLSTVCLQTQSI